MIVSFSLLAIGIFEKQFLFLSQITALLWSSYLGYDYT